MTRLAYNTEGPCDSCDLSDQSEEVILAQEQGANVGKAGAKNELEAEFGAEEREGTLVLTNKRLIFVCTEVRGDDFPTSFLGKIRLLYSDVGDVGLVPKEPPSIFITLAFISSARGPTGGVGRPSLEVEMSDEGDKHAYMFTEVLTGRRKRNPND